MFDIGWGELVVIGIVALIAIGPKELPGVLRSLGHWMGKIRRMASEFQGQFQEAMREAEMTDLKKSVDDLNASASAMGNYDPLADAQKQVDEAFNIKSGGAADSSGAAPAGRTTAAMDASTPTTTPTPAPATGEAVETGGAPQVSSSLLPAADVYVPLPEPAPPVGDKDFAPAEPSPPKQAGGARPA